jgi:Tfp pilus assembly protein PilO
LEEGLHLNRNSSTSIMVGITLVGAFFTAYFTKGLTALETLDFWCANVLIFLMAGVQIVMFGWILGIKKGMEELERGSATKIPSFYRFVIKYIAPSYLIIVFIAWAVMNLPEYLLVIQNNVIVQLSLGFIALVIAFNLFVTSQALHRWEKNEKQLRNTADGEL